MLTAPILYVGEDICRRVSVLEKVGARVRRTPCSASALSEALSGNAQYSAIAFHEDQEPIPQDVLEAARPCPSPLILFENPVIPYNPADFDLIIPALAPPIVWLRSIQSTISESRKLLVKSQELRKDVASVRAETVEQRARMHRLLSNPIDLDEIWHLDRNTGHPSSFSPGQDDPQKKS